MTMLYTMVIIWYLGSAGGQNIVVTGFPTIEACQAAIVTVRNSIASQSRGMHGLCFEVVR